MGIAVIALSIRQLLESPVSHEWLILAALTLVTGSATIRIPSVPATISVSETFVITSVLLFGPEAGTVTVALDSLIISFWLSQRQQPLHRILFNLSAPALSIWLAAHVYEAASTTFAHSGQPTPIAFLLPPLLLFTSVYFLLNSGLTAVAISFEDRLSATTIWKHNFAWLSLNYLGGASLAAILVSYAGNVDLVYLTLIVPLVLVLYLTFRTSIARVEDVNSHIAQLNALYVSTIETLAMAIDAKDQITHGHVRRVQAYATGLARAMGVADDHTLKAIEAAALLHDMGKLAVPEHILNKPGRLTPAEFEKMKQHATIGADILAAISFPYPVVPLVRHHHENYDGTGYPTGLKGDEIPLGARVLAVVDCFDALTSDRPYRPRLSDRSALAILRHRSGHMYDPSVVNAFVGVYKTLRPVERELHHQQEALTAITESTALVMEPTYSVAFEPSKATARRLLALYDIATILTHRRLPGDYFELVGRHVLQLVPSSFCLLFLYQSRTDELVAIRTAGERGVPLEGVRIRIGQKLTGWVAAHRQVAINADPALDFGELIRTITPRPRSCISTPLLHSDQLVGVLNLYSTHRQGYDGTQGQLLELISPLLARLAAQDPQSCDRSGARNVQGHVVASR